MKFNKHILLCLILVANPVLPFASGQANEEIRDLIFEYGKIGYDLVDQHRNLDTAEYYLSEALRLQYSTPGYEIDIRVAANHINLAAVYKRIYNNGEALNHLNIAETILKETDPDSPYLGFIYNNKGNIIKRNYDIYRTKSYYEYALDWLTRTGRTNTSDYLEVYSNYLDILVSLDDKELVNSFLAESIPDYDDLDPNLSFDFHMNNAEILASMDEIDKASEHFKSAKELLEMDILRNDIQSHYTYYKDFVLFNIETNDFEKAHETLIEVTLFINTLNKYSKKIRVTYTSSFQYYYAQILYLEGKHEKALKIINTTTEMLVDFFEEQNYTSQNTKVKDESASYLPELYTLKSRVLFDLFSVNGLEITLKEAFHAYLNSIEVLNTTKLNMQFEDSKFFATANVLDVYNEAIYTGKLLYERTGNMDFLEKAFEFTENSKSFALFSEIKDVEAMEFSDLPHDVRIRETSLNGKIQGYEELLNRQLISPEPDSTLIALYNDELFHLRDDYGDLLQEIELNNSQYFELKYEPRFVTLKEVQEKLAYKDALFEYVLTDTLLITYVIDKKGINVISQEVDPAFSDECLEYYQLVHTQNFSKGVHANYRRFIELGRKFYSILVEPCLEFTDKKNFTIVPDGAITYLTFDGLLTADADPEYINYLTLPYMIKEYSVGYSHSSTLLFNERMKTKPTEDEVLAFAPKYKNILNFKDTSLVRQVSGDRNLLLPLFGTIKEVQSIDEIVPSRIFLNEEATESNFKKLASDYNVLHLAMHTLMKDDNPLHSMLAFTNLDIQDTTEDNRLYAYEIYNLKLNAQMAVLSSCNSGVGKMQKGEGMMSLARGFIYAGCPSIVMTLWQVADQSSSKLMASFYKYLKKGRSKQEAMRLAKIDYLETADDITSNPYFWSGFVVLGDSSPVYRKSGAAYYISIILIFIGILMYLQYRKP